MTQDDIDLALRLVPPELLNTIYMVLGSGLIATIIGLPLGVILTLIGPGRLKECRWLYSCLGSFVNTGRSFPFVILMVALIPITRLIVGTSIGNTAAIVPLSIAAIPFIARLVEAALNEVDKSVLEAAQSMGSTTWQIVTKVLIPEAGVPLVQSVTITLINLLGYSTMAGTMGAGGLGKIAILYGYQRFNLPLIIITVAVMVALVQILQVTGNFIGKRINIKRGKEVLR